MDGREADRANAGVAAAAAAVWIRSHSTRIMRRLLPNFKDLNGYAMAGRLLTSQPGALDREIRRELENQLGPDYSGNLVVKIKVEIIKMMQQRAQQHRPARGGEEEEICSICWDRLGEEDDDAIAALDCTCRHEFHVDCIMQWLLKGKNNSCPLCRGKAVHVLWRTESSAPYS